MAANTADMSDFERTALPYLDNVYRAAMVLSVRSDRADDLVQQTFLKALAQFATFRRGSNCRAWLLKRYPMRGVERPSSRCSTPWVR